MCVTNRGRLTPLHHAALRGETEAMELLLKAAANVDAVTEYVTHDTQIGLMSLLIIFLYISLVFK